MRIDWLSPCRLRNGYLQRCGTTALSKKTRAEVVLAVIWTPGQARPWKENEKCVLSSRGAIDCAYLVDLALRSGAIA